VLHHERNAGNLAVGALVLGMGGMVHDLGAVAEPEFPRAFQRALNAHVVVVLGRLGEESLNALDDAGFEPTSSDLALEPGGGFGFGHGVVRDDTGRVSAHVVTLPLDPSSAVVAATLLVLPLLARLQGDESSTMAALRATWDAPQPMTVDKLRAVPATLHAGADGRLRARPAVAFGPVELPDLALADGLALFPPGEGPWHGGEVVEFAPFAPWPGRADD
jgi:molybdopterin biosynthesis enzyme